MRLAVFVLSSLVIALFASTNGTRADSCKSILDEFKTLSDRSNREVNSAAANLQEAASEVANDKRRIALIARSCAAAAEALGVFKSYRIAVAGCMGDRETGRANALDELDRSISRLRVSLDKACR